MGNTSSTQLHHQPQHHPQQQPNEEDEPENQELTCEICIEPCSKHFNNFNKCSHPFCTDCVTKYIHTKLNEDNNGTITCPDFNCQQTLDPLDFAPIINPPLFVRWCDVLCETAISGVDKCYCPYGNCSVPILNECGGNPKKSGCPKCKRLFCFECKRFWHAGFGCEESGVLRDRNEVALGRLAEASKWQRCPGCRHFVERVEGCKIVTCRCSISFCYKCGKQVDSHYCPCTPGYVCCGMCIRCCCFLIGFIILWGLLGLILGVIVNTH